MSERTMCYIGTKPCGCVIAFVLDDPKYARDTARAVAEFIQDGLAVTRVPIDDCRAQFCRCTHDKKQAALL